jgi:hypothetical protein
VAAVSPPRPAPITDVRDLNGLSWHSVDTCNDIIDIMDGGIRPCVIHYPTRHAMRDWPLYVRDDKEWLIERICPHGVGHPDPDSLWYFLSVGKKYMAVHGCDGCCVPPKEKT